MAGNSEVRLWAYVSGEANARIRLLAFTRAKRRGTVGRICGEAVQEFLEQHRAEHDRVIADYLQNGRRTGNSWTVDDRGDAQGIWAYVNEEAFKRLALLALAYGLPRTKTHLLVTQAVYEYLNRHWEEHDGEIASIRKLLDAQPREYTGRWTLGSSK